MRPTKEDLLQNTAIRVLLDEAKVSRSVLSDKEWANDGSEFHKKCRSDLQLQAEQCESALDILLRHEALQSRIQDLEARNRELTEVFYLALELAKAMEENFKHFKGRFIIEHHSWMWDKMNEILKADQSLKQNQ